jgi:hypothetical protein
MRVKLDHDSIHSVLLTNGFYQNGTKIRDTWLHAASIVAYYTSNKRGIMYIIRYKLDEYEAKTATELNHILTGFKNRNILT